MKFKLNLLIVLFITVFSSCSDDDFTDQMPKTPNSVEIDVNEDGLIDYTIDFVHISIFSNNSSEGIRGEIIANGENEVLQSRDVEVLFIRDLENIKESVSEPIFWNNPIRGEAIVSISNNRNGNWPIEWEIQSDTIYSTYFVGLKILNNDMTELGWIELDINNTTGEVKVLNKGVL